jgi:taurine dioxygenase
MVLFWDNRCAQHSAIHDYYPKRRLMERVTIKGERPVAASDAVDPSAVRRYLNPPVMDFESRQKRQHEL